MIIVDGSRMLRINRNTMNFMERLLGKRLIERIVIQITHEKICIKIQLDLKMILDHQIMYSLKSLEQNLILKYGVYN